VYFLLSFSKIGNTEYIKKTFELADLHNITLKLAVFATAIQNCIPISNLDAMDVIFQRMLKSGPMPDQLLFETILHAFGNKDRLEKMEQVMDIMKSNNYPITLPTYNFMVGIYAKKGQNEKLIATLEDIKRANLPLSFNIFRFITRGWFKFFLFFLETLLEIWSNLQK
jgi:pentatricopeptide repeat protein